MKETWEVLVSQRWPKSNNERGKWEFPGGTVEFWDTLHDTVAKEIKEETWVDVEVERFLWVFDHILEWESQHWINNVFLARYIGGEISISEEEKEKIIDPQWMDIEKAQNLDLTQASKQTLEAYYKVFPASHTEKLKLISIVYADCIERSRMFYECFGMTFQKEQHGKGPVHYSSLDWGTLFEIYPKSVMKKDTNTHALAIETHTEGNTLEALISKGFISTNNAGSGVNKKWMNRYIDPDGRKVLHFIKNT